MTADYRREQLPNGLRVLAVENPVLHSFVISAYVHAGPRFESPEQIGLTHLLEHMLMQGSENYPDSSAVMRGIEDLGGVLDAGTYPEYVNVAVGVHRKHWAKALHIATDVILRPLFDAREVEQERQIVAQEISQHRDRQGRVISAPELAHCLRFRGTLNEAGTRGSRELLQTFDQQAVLEHYQRLFTPRNTVLCLAGGFCADEVIDSIAEEFGAMQGGDGLPELPPVPDESAGRRRSVYRRTEALPVAEVLLSHRACGMGDEGYDACRAVAHLLGGGLSSRLFSRVREELGLVYEIHSHLQGYSDAGALDVFLSVGTENLVPAVEAALGVVREAAEEGFAEDELTRYKEAARCGAEIMCDRATLLADWFGKQEVLLGGERVITPQRYAEIQETLSLADLYAAMQDVLVAAPADLVVVGPYGDGEQKGLSGVFCAEQMTPGQP